MDGLAVRAADTADATPTSPKRLKVGVNAIPVNTGEPVPEDMDAVIMVEDVAETGEREIEIVAAASPWQYTRLMGEDIVASDIVLPARHRLRPADVGALLAAGILEVEVLRRPRVAVIPTGGEIVPPGEAREPGQVPDFNSPMVAARLSEVGATTLHRSGVGDEPDALRTAIEEACEDHDLVLTLAGVSAGERDLTAEAIGAAGEVLIHGVAIRPGKPVALGIVRGKPVIALPGYPASAMLCCDLFVVPSLCRMLGLPAPQRETATAVLSRKVASLVGSEEFLRVRLGQVGDRLIAVPTGRGAGLVSVLARADGLVIIPALSEGLAKGAEVGCELFRPIHELRNAILVTGSHDVALDLLAGEIHTRAPELTVASTHVGSMAGLAALREGYCHMAGSHLLDPETGHYNWPYIQRLFGEDPVTVVTLAHRQQGFMVAPGNPRGLRTWDDLGRGEIRLINRQAGAGTRVLLDTELAERKIDPRRLDGYGREVYTHLAVASVVESGAADVGLGIRAAARARGLDFVPLAMERYDLVMSPAVWESPFGEALRQTLAGQAFRDELTALGGYDTQETGMVQQPPSP
jgi:putative molybdopterin biosynthesis protein